MTSHFKNNIKNFTVSIVKKKYFFKLIFFIKVCSISAPHIIRIFQVDSPLFIPQKSIQNLTSYIHVGNKKYNDQPTTTITPAKPITKQPAYLPSYIHPPRKCSQTQLLSYLFRSSINSKNDKVRFSIILRPDQLYAPPPGPSSYTITSKKDGHALSAAPTIDRPINIRARTARLSRSHREREFCHVWPFRNSITRALE